MKQHSYSGSFTYYSFLAVLTELEGMFKPTISASSKKMLTTRKKGDVMERLYWTKEKLAEDKAKKEKESAANELKECTFVPQISSKNKNAGSRRSTQPIHERLFPKEKQLKEKEAAEKKKAEEEAARKKKEGAAKKRRERGSPRRSPLRSPTQAFEEEEEGRGHSSPIPDDFDDDGDGGDDGDDGDVEALSDEAGGQQAQLQDGDLRDDEAVLEDDEAAMEDKFVAAHDEEVNGGTEGGA
jgi:hypothetical protein